MQKNFFTVVAGLLKVKIWDLLNNYVEY
jgi:hypothetical protein